MIIRLLRDLYKILIHNHCFLDVLQKFQLFKDFVFKGKYIACLTRNTSSKCIFINDIKTYETHSQYNTHRLTKTITINI